MAAAWRALACLLILICVTAAPHDDSGVAERRPGRAGYVTINNKRYYLDDVIRRSYSQASDYCVALSMRLVGLETEVEDLAIRDYLAENGIVDKQFWTSGSKVAGSWTWVGSGVPFFYTNWAVDEPNSELSSPCVHTAIPDWGWADEDCSLSFYYICE